MLKGIEQVDRWVTVMHEQVATAPMQAAAITTTNAYRVQSRAAAYIRAAPGPKRVRRDRPRRTNYVASFRVEKTMTPLGLEVEAGTDLVYGWRLEKGFVGSDSLGRHYNQAPRPHWGPAADDIAPHFELELTQMAVNFASRP